MRLGQRLFNLLKQAKGHHVPLSHIVAVVKLPQPDVAALCSRLVAIGKVQSKYERNGPAHELHYWVEPKGGRR